MIANKTVNYPFQKIPWFTFEAIEFVISIIRPDWNIFEWGSGGSTVFFRERAKSVISIEHDLEFYEILIQCGLGHDNLKFIPPEPETSSALAEHPSGYRTSDLALSKFQFVEYVKIIDTFGDNYFDMVVIDGRSRPSCILHAIPKVKAGGWLILDNSDRSTYSMGKALLHDWESHAFKGHGPYTDNVWETTAYQKGIV